MTTSSPKSQAYQNRKKAEADIEDLYKIVQPTEGKSNHNYLALRGYDVDDMEFVEEFGVPKDFAYTRKLNDYMLDLVMTEAQSVE